MLMSARLIIILSVLACLAAASVHAERAETFEQAKRLSVQTGKPVLLEFNHDDCPHCQQATRELDSIPQVRAKLDSVVLLRLSVLQGEGTTMAETFRIGASFPVFIVTDSAANVMVEFMM